MSIDIEAAFADLDQFYPGSKRKRREATAVVEKDTGDWDARPMVKTSRLHEGRKGSSR